LLLANRRLLTVPSLGVVVIVIFVGTDVATGANSIKIATGVVIAVDNNGSLCEIDLALLE
jgi:hypothetical protein